MKELFSALSKFQSEVKNPSKDKKGVHGSSYSPIEEVWEVARDLLGKHGLSLVQFPVDKSDNGKFLFGFKSYLGHSSGEFIESEFYVPQLNIDHQKLGASMTYLRRYSACSILGITPEDEDLDADNSDTQAVKKAHAMVNNKPNNNHKTDNKHGYIPNTIPFGKSFGKKFTDIPVIEVEGAYNWAKSKGKFAEFQKEAEEFLKSIDKKVNKPQFTNNEIPF